MLCNAFFQLFDLVRHPVNGRPAATRSLWPCDRSCRPSFFGALLFSPFPQFIRIYIPVIRCSRRVKIVLQVQDLRYHRDRLCTPFRYGAQCIVQHIPETGHEAGAVAERLLKKARCIIQHRIKRPLCGLHNQVSQLDKPCNNHFHDCDDSIPGRFCPFFKIIPVHHDTCHCRTGSCNPCNNRRCQPNDTAKGNYSSPRRCHQGYAHNCRQCSESCCNRPGKTCS